MKFIFPLLAAICVSIAASLFYDMVMTLFQASDFIRGYFAILCISLPGIVTFFAMIWADLPEDKTEKDKMWEAYLAGDYDSWALTDCSYDMKARFEKWYKEINEQN